MIIDYYGKSTIVQYLPISGGESIRMYGGRRANDNPKAKFPALMDDNSD